MCDCGKDCQTCEKKTIKVSCILCGKEIELPEDQDPDDLAICDRCADRMDD